MDSLQPTDIRAKVIAFLSKELKVDNCTLQDDTRIFHDLGVDGDDAIELIESFSQQFDVDVSGFPYEQYFGAEVSLSPFAIITQILGKRKKFQPLCVADLVSAVKLRKL